MATRSELAAELLDTLARISRAHVEMTVPEHEDLRLCLKSDAGAVWALEAAGRFPKDSVWKVRSVSSSLDGRFFHLHLTVEKEEQAS
jgi:hypothetical protein